MKKLTKVLCSTILVIIALTALSACTSTAATAQRICTIRQESRGDAVAVRDAIALRFDTFDANTQAKLKRLDVTLQELDTIGAAACSHRSFDGARALDLALRGVSLAADLKAKGVI